MKAFFPATAIVLVVYVWLGYSMNHLKDPILAMAVYYPVICLGGGFLIRKFGIAGHGKKVDPAGGPRENVIRTVALSLIGTALLWSSVLLFRPGLVDPDILANRLAAYGLNKGDFWLVAWMVVLINPVLEEYLWRYALLPLLADRFRGGIAVNISALLFAGYHPIVVAGMFPAVWLIAVFLIVYAGGVALASLFLRTRNLLYPIAFHMIVNVNIMLMGYLYAPKA
jgi:membrane protease YdiL (CAAX protease family)